MFSCKAIAMDDNLIEQRNAKINEQYDILDARRDYLDDEHHHLTTGNESDLTDTEETEGNTQYKNFDERLASNEEEYIKLELRIKKLLSDL